MGISSTPGAHRKTLGRTEQDLGREVTQWSKDEFAKMLKTWRERKGFSQLEVAEELGLPSKRPLQNWEIARTRPVGLAYGILLKIVQPK